jgi:Zn-dependent M28 family amino/carboxypeptidase
MQRAKKLVVIASLLLLPAACTKREVSELGSSGRVGDPELQVALGSFNQARLLEQVRTLASDKYEGRLPGTRGEELTINYLVEEFRTLGLKPGNPDGTYLQKVPLVGITGEPKVTFSYGNQKISVQLPQDCVAFSPRRVPEVKIENSEMIFVGYGIIAPEYGWDDYKGTDVTGKTLVMLINDPPVPDPQDPSKLDEKMFKGKAMTYYGRWTYKYEIASKLGATAAIIIHETVPAGYPYEVVSSSWGRENFDTQNPDKNLNQVAVELWMHLDIAKTLLKISGQDFESLKRSAGSRDFRPMILKTKANFWIKNKIREIQSNNVVAKLEGSDPSLKDEYVIHMAHWDHLGKDPKLQGDQIFNGAVDNATGTAGLLDIAEAYTQLKTPPRRSVLFLSVTAEEQGLLGSKYYAENPLYPLTRTVATINMDGLNTWGRTKDVAVIGLGNSSLDDVLEEEAQLQGRTIVPDPEPEKGYYYRSDHFEFAKKGVPALDTNAGIEIIGKPARYGRQKRDEYTARDYHKVTDEVKPGWDLSGTIEDLQLLFLVGYRVAQDSGMPQWKPGSEFKEIRAKMMQSSKP